MKKQTIKQIKELYNDEIKFCGIKSNIINIKVPYDQGEIEIEIEGDTAEEQVESFIFEVNNILDNMINYLEDVKLSQNK